MKEHLYKYSDQDLRDVEVSDVSDMDETTQLYLSRMEEEVDADASVDED